MYGSSGDGLIQDIMGNADKDVLSPVSYLIVSYYFMTKLYPKSCVQDGEYVSALKIF